ncbi:hypothetical protein ACSFA3_18400 [Variovorax sp. RHLX14]|uniref:hypothetical protein n=1 Tax=Variovorax sp. RHLX14 TaxID=1259731 RepID=UPI003F46DD80
MPTFFLLPIRQTTAHTAIALALTAVLGACTPTFNWRDVRIADKGLVALLPCKADRATRALPLGIESVEVEMAGCEAGGATFAVAHAAAADAAQAEAWLRAWRAATRAQLVGGEVAELAGTIPRSLAVPAPWRLETQHNGSATAAAPARVLWFAQRTASGVSLYQATVLGTPSSPEVFKTFFEGLRLP